MEKDDGLSQEVQRLLDELCVDLGFCLPPEEQRRLREAPPPDVDSFTDAVFRAEGMDPRLTKKLRRKVRAKVQRSLPTMIHKPED